MALRERIGVIGGGGWLGSAMIRAAIAKGAVDPAKVMLSGRSLDKKSAAGIEGVRWTTDNAELVGSSDVVVLSVRPFQFRDVVLPMSSKLVISVMAGVTCDAIASETKASRVVRSIPNAAAAVGQSFTPWFAAGETSEHDKEIVRALLQASGEEAEVSLESHIDYCVGFTGSGAAFPALLAEALVSHAVSHGIPREFAERAARKVVSGASQLFAGPDGDTGAIVKEMIDYRGVVAAALQAMLDQGFMAAVSSGLDAASAKAATIAGA